MTGLLPTLTEEIARARADLRIGLPVRLVTPGGTWLATAVESLTPDRLAALTATGPLVMAITAQRAEVLKTAAYDGDLLRLHARPDLRWLRAMADPAQDLDYPLKTPLQPIRDGDPLPARAAIALAKSAQLLPAVLLTPAPDTPGLTTLDAALTLPELTRAAQFHPIAAASLPIAASEATRLHVYRPDDGGTEHYAIEIASPDRDAPVLTRLHSACFTGDVLGSLKCDCGPQLHAAIDAMAQAGGGVLLYLNQEGRGIGLANKMRAYSLQNQGFDTVEANHRLGFQDDERDFRIGAALLAELGINCVRLLTNNPRKIAMLQSQGIEVTERVPLIVDRNRHNAAYLAVKAAKSGHLL
ncbi:MAG: GTP cyclohydrolase II [Paracoccus sp. (in: a-proteobacteria)]|uniref:GTP cyclohydrolase II n=1 Tax=Paracoccus sp. TaxID=267 RepID=UPI0026DFB51A|nr:GTP cyclohydrolase II [Paracoccus sp. (in: a-proteobacteria)]MDO5621482.1 GTP cyclohydrolase II [Paracoccus sp. (in: a-proteobacteria)]